MKKETVLFCCLPTFSYLCTQMYSLTPFRIDLKGLHDAITRFSFRLTDAYFEAIDALDIRKGALDAMLCVKNNEGFFEVDFHIEGEVTIACDLCLDDMQQPILTDNRLIVKYGPTYAEEDDLVTVCEDEGILDVAWFIYEFIVLNIPIRHVHAPGKCNPAMMKVLEEHSASRSGVEDGEATVDPRWQALLKLNNKE